MRKRRSNHLFIPAVVAVLILGYALAAWATFSIVAYDDETKEWGIAVASREVAVGYGVTWAEAGAGAVVTQALIEPAFGRDGLMMMGAGFTADQTLRALLDRDESDETRQVALIDAQGGVAVFSGEDIGRFAGDRKGLDYSIQGNTLVGDTVLTAMEHAFVGSEGPLALRLLEALLAGDAAGGDRRGRQSAALLVVRERGDFRRVTDRMVDLRIDNHPDAAQELARTFDQFAVNITIHFYFESDNQLDTERGVILAEWLISREEQKENPNGSLFNAAAWLMANKRIKPRRAVELALRADELIPGNWGVMDTVAEAYFAAGDAGSAVEWIRRALEFEPDREYLKQQLVRFSQPSD